MKTKIRSGIISGHPNGITFMSKPHELEKPAMNKKIPDRFGVTTMEPNGTTFTPHTARMAQEWGGDMKDRNLKQTKKPDRFGVTDREPGETTFMGNKSHIDFPNADVKPLPTKALSSSSGLYQPARKSVDKNSVGDVPTSKSSSKSGKFDKRDIKVGYGK